MARRWARSRREPDVALSAETAAAVREVVLPMADKLAALLDDAEPETRAAALRVLAKLGDERVTPARIATAAFDASPAMAAAAVVRRRAPDRHAARPWRRPSRPRWRRARRRLVAPAHRRRRCARGPRPGRCSAARARARRQARGRARRAAVEALARKSY